MLKEESTSFFRENGKDGKRRRIDYILAYEPGTKDEEKKKERREIFQANLKREGLELEFEDKEVSFTH